MTHEEASPTDDRGIKPTAAAEDSDLSCLGGPGDCAGPVEYRTTPDRSDGRAFPRCEAHFTERLASAERTLELLSPCPAPWFDPSYAGERWDED